MALGGRKTCENCVGRELELENSLYPLFAKKKKKHRRTSKYYQSLVKPSTNNWIVLDKSSECQDMDHQVKESKQQESIDVHSEIRPKVSKTIQNIPIRVKRITDLEQLKNTQLKESPTKFGKLKDFANLPNPDSGLSQDIIRFTSVKDSIKKNLNLKRVTNIKIESNSKDDFADLIKSEGMQRKLSNGDNSESSGLIKWLKNDNQLNQSEEGQNPKNTQDLKNQKTLNTLDESPKMVAVHLNIPKKNKRRLSNLQHHFQKNELKKNKKSENKQDQEDVQKAILDSLGTLFKWNVLQRKVFLKNKNAILATCYQPTVFNVLKFDKIIPKILPFTFVSERLNFILKMVIVLNKQVSLYQVVLYLLVVSYFFVYNHLHFEVNDQEQAKLYFRVKDENQGSLNASIDDQVNPTEMANEKNISFKQLEKQTKVTASFQVSNELFEMKEVASKPFAKLFIFLNRLGLENARLLIHKFFQLEHLKIEEAALKFGFKQQLNFDRNFHKILTKTTENHKKFLKIIRSIKDLGKGFFDLDSLAAFFTKNGGVLRYLTQFQGIQNLLSKRKKGFSPSQVSQGKDQKIDLTELNMQPDLVKKRMELALFAYIRKFKNLPTNKDESSNEEKDRKYSFDK